MLVIVVALMFHDPYPLQGQISNATPTRSAESAGKDWAAYGGTTAGQRFSSLDQITQKNVGKLSVAWEYHTGDLRDAGKDAGEYTFEATPLKINDRVYVCTPYNEVHALNPQTGELAWKYTPEKNAPTCSSIRPVGASAIIPLHPARLARHHSPLNAQNASSPPPQMPGWSRLMQTLVNCAAISATVA